MAAQPSDTPPALAYWESLLAGRDFPALEDLEPGAFKDFQDQSFLLDLTDDPAGDPAQIAVLRHVGAAVVALGEADIDTDTPLKLLGEESIIANLADHLAAARDHKSPLSFEAALLHEDGHTVPYSGLLLPLSDDGRTVHYILGVLDGEAPAPTDQGSPIPAEPAPAAAQPVSGHALAALYDKLVAGRQAAEAAGEAAERSHGALYTALAATLGIVEATEAAPAAYRRLLAETGLKVQERAPLTPILKLVFGLDHDKTRLADYAAGLSFARREGCTADTVAAFFAAYPGGLRGCVKAERALRRHARGNARVDRLEAAKARLRAQVPISRLSAPPPDTVGEGDPVEEFVLLIGRRTDDGGVDVIQTLKEAPKTLNSLIARAARRVRE